MVGNRLSRVFQQNILTNKLVYAILFFAKNKKDGFFTMTLYDELYFEIRAMGAKSEVEKFLNYMRSGEPDEFFEFDEEYILCDDDYAGTSDADEVTVIISNDDYGIEIDEFYTDEFLDTICKAGRRIYLKGQLYDADNEEYSFVSEAGNSYYINALLIGDFNEDEDRPVEYDNDDEDED